MSSFQIMPLGDQGIQLELANVISPEVNQQVHQLAHLLEKDLVEGVVEVVPAYSTLTVYYEPLKIGFNKLVAKLTEQMEQLSTVVEEGKKRNVIIPVLYGGELGPDLEYVGEHNQLSPSDVVTRHISQEYLAYMIGFTPGFPYLGGMDDRIATPRKSNPRKYIKAGSVGIAGSQTGIYSIDSPGGWQIIGHTPIPLFNPKIRQPVLIQAGDTITFTEIKRNEYNHILSLVEEGSYEPTIEFI